MDFSCEELNKGDLGKNHTIGRFPETDIVSTVFNFDHYLKKTHNRTNENLFKIGAAPVKIGMTMNVKFHFFNFCPTCGQKIDASKYMNLIYKSGKLY